MSRHWKQREVSTSFQRERRKTSHVEKIKIKQPWNSQQQPWKLEHNSGCSSKLWAKKMIPNLFPHTAQLPIKDGDRITIFWDKAQKFYFPFQKATRRSEMKQPKRKVWGADNKRSDRGEMWMKTPKGDKGLGVQTGHHVRRSTSPAWSTATQEENARKVIAWLLSAAMLGFHPHEPTRECTLPKQRQKPRKRKTWEPGKRESDLGEKQKDSQRLSAKGSLRMTAVQEAWGAASRDGRERRSPEGKSGREQPELPPPPPSCHESPWESVARLREQ